MTRISGATGGTGISPLNGGSSGGWGSGWMGSSGGTMGNKNPRHKEGGSGVIFRTNSRRGAVGGTGSSGFGARADSCGGSAGGVGAAVGMKAPGGGGHIGTSGGTMGNCHA